MEKFSSLLLLLMLLMSACATKKPASSEAKNDPKPIERNSSPPAAAGDLDGIKTLAENSSCAKINWKDRGVAPKGYIKGMALVYAQELCNPHPSTSKVTGSPDKDALAYYGIAGNVKNTFAFMIGLGMRESSGAYCTGVDASASNHASDTAEAGTFQTSYNAANSHPSLPGMLKNYSGKCFLDIFKEGVPIKKCNSANLKNYGSGNGLAFQEKVKSCPTFGAHFAAVTIRELRKHYGPINRKEAQFKNECVSMLTEIESIVKNNPEICEVLK